MAAAILSFALGVATLVQGLRYDPTQVAFNLNQNQAATNPVDYSASRPGHTYWPSPDDWRFPIYTLFLDRFANGDPSNDNANGTVFEQDLTSNQLRHGGDLQGLVDSLDYIQGMGIKGIYIAGSPFINEPWGVDSYSPLDLTLLDFHFGNISMWQSFVDAVHARGMYVVLDHTMSTMGDLIAFKGFENTSVPFENTEHEVLYVSERQYLDFAFGNDYNETCTYPRFWNETGFRVNQTGPGSPADLKGCFNSEFDQYGDIEAFGVFPDWQRSLARFASVQDRLREWHEPVLDKLKTFSCLAITMLDIDGFRFDKATQLTVDALADHNSAVRRCATALGKTNFFLAGEITGGNNYGSIYLGRGRQPDQEPDDLTLAMNLTTKPGGTDELAAGGFVIRDRGQNALDAAAFHYTVYRSLTRFLGMSGNLEAGFDLPSDFSVMFGGMVLTNDLVNPNTGVFDPRHMLGVTNQDVFRWPSIAQGVERQLLGSFMTTLHIPGIPLVYYGEEQAFYVLDNTADNYIFGRQPVTASQAWMLHGCHALGSSQYVGWPVDSARNGCRDPTVAYDHRDPSHPVRNILKAMYAMRDNYPGLQEGWNVQLLQNKTFQTVLPGSNETASEFGVWSVARTFAAPFQGQFANNQVWLVYHNQASQTGYSFDCASDEGFVAPFDANTTVKNLFYPWDEVQLEASPKKLGFAGSPAPNGCVSQLAMQPFEFRAYVPKAAWVGPPPMVTRFTPGHDAPLDSATLGGTVPITLEFSAEMDCDALTEAITISSTTESGSGSGTGSATTPTIGKAQCTAFASPSPVATFVGSIPSLFRYSVDLTNVADGIHQITITNATTSDGKASTGTTDHFLLRVGARTNPIVWPGSANYSSTLLTSEGGRLSVNHAAAGADQWRYSTNWGTTYSNWTAYTGGKQAIERLPWSGTSLQAWSGDHVIVQYWSRALASSSFTQSGDVDVDSDSGTSSSSSSSFQRRYPHLFAMGQFNKFGFDAGVANQFSLAGDGRWEAHLMDEWPSQFQLNVWGMNPDGRPDASWVLGDVDLDGVADRMPPTSLALNAFNASAAPAMPALSWKLVFDDSSLAFELRPQGSVWIQIILFVLLATVPVAGGLAAVWIFMGSFYKVKVNKVGFKKTRGRSPLRSAAARLSRVSFDGLRGSSKQQQQQQYDDADGTELGAVAGKRRKVIIATMEYNIDDWNIKIKIGGLGVMAQLMGKALEHQDLVWVVPCVGGIEYPVDQRAEPMYAPIMGREYEVEVQYHQVQNITYVLLDAPIFRQQSKTDPYPPRMDDMDSAIYYSAWNFCIAEAIRRFDPDLYHINDYHGAAAPLYLLPERTIPCALSLHNAEFQGMWPMRNPAEAREVCDVFNLDAEVVKEYVQFGSVFNLLHAGASYLRVHQKGFGAVGVSKKYGDRSYARYPIFWGLSKIGQLPNPDPSDTAEWSRDEQVSEKDVVVDADAEGRRGDLRRQAQEWAGLEADPEAELFVFVGRWSLQKGVDLIADIFPSVLDKYPRVQLICIGPVIDLYGRFAALKLAKLMERYPRRVFSKPEFTQLPPYIFGGAEFALIPSRDEPFGLVAVEFGRKGALGVGARVGGLGQMPGFWYTIESTAPQHLLRQFRGAIVRALESKTPTRQKMRAWSAKQRFPVAQWVEDLDKLQAEAIRIHGKEAKKRRRITSGSLLTVPSTIDLHGHGNNNNNNSNNRSSGSSYSGGNRQFFEGSSELETPQQSTRHSRASSLSVPFITETDHDAELEEEQRRRRSGSNPFGDPVSPPIEEEPTERAGSGDGNDGNDGADEPFLPPNPVFLNRASRSSTASSMATIVANDPNQAGSRFSVDTFANRLMSADAADRRPHNFGLQQLQLQQQQQGGAAAAAGALQVRPEGDFYSNRNSSRLSVIDVVGDRHDFKLQKVDPFFTDSTGEYYRSFEQKLGALTPKNSETELCIDDYLKASEKKWFKEFRDAKLGRSRSPSRVRGASVSSAKSSSSSPPVGLSLAQDASTRSRSGHTRVRSTASVNSLTPSEEDEEEDDEEEEEEEENAGAAAAAGGNGGSNGGGNDDGDDEFLLGKGYKPPRGLKKWLSIRVGDWPVYSFILALGQILAANSYQIALLAGESGQTANQLYIVSGTYAATTVVWWLLFRRFKALYSLSLPWFLYGLAFLLIGVTPFLPASVQPGVQDGASAIYAAAASSGGLFFALNFGDEGGAPIEQWIFRAAIIQGIQQLYIVGLFYWGSLVTGQAGVGTLNGIVIANEVPVVLVIAVPLALVLWLLGVVSFVGLPDYYRQSPDKIPSFYKSLLRRHVVPWFFLTVALQNYFLSAPYGRNWAFLFYSRAIPSWSAAVLAVGYFTLVWAFLLFLFSRFSKTHPWIVPMFAIGLGAPRWAQMLWGTSGIGLFLPWVGGSVVASAIVSRALWLWLGVLDAVQGVGIGMVLLLTLTRQHVAATLFAAQFIGAAFTILARATAPDKDGPGDVFPDFSQGAFPGLAKPWFWVALALQLILPIGFFKFFRKEQVAKP